MKQQIKYSVTDKNNPKKHYPLMSAKDVISLANNYEDGNNFNGNLSGAIEYLYTFEINVEKSQKLAKGSTIESDKGVDLFEDYDQIPENLQRVLDKHQKAFEDGSYKGLQKALKEVNKLGYTFEYYLDGQAYDLRKIGQKGKTAVWIEENESDKYAKGSTIKGEKYELKSQPAYNQYDKQVGTWYRIYDKKGNLQTLFYRKRLKTDLKYSITDVLDKSLAEKILKDMNNGKHDPNRVIEDGEKYAKGSTIEPKLDFSIQINKDDVTIVPLTFESAEFFANKMMKNKFAVYGKEISVDYYSIGNILEDAEQRGLKFNKPKFEKGGTMKGFNYTIGGL